MDEVKLMDLARNLIINECKKKPKRGAEVVINNVTVLLAWEVPMLDQEKMSWNEVVREMVNNYFH